VSFAELTAAPDAPTPAPAPKVVGSEPWPEPVDTTLLLNELVDGFRFNDAILRHLVMKRDDADTEQSLIMKFKDEKGDKPERGERGERRRRDDDSTDTDGEGDKSDAKSDDKSDDNAEAA